MINKKVLINNVFLILSFIQSTSVAAEIKYPFKDINPKKEIKEFIKLHQCAITDDPNLVKTQMAKFAVGEYYFKHNNFTDSDNTFRKYINDYPPQISTFIAKIFLFKIAKLQNNIEEITILKKEFFSKPFILLFSDSKVLEYTSVFGNNYILYSYINRVEVFLNGELFEKTAP